MSTPHINAAQDAFAPTCLLPGDPLRAKFITEQFLDNATCVTSVRNMLGYTGSYRGKPISVMGTGMGMPSCAIYATELIRDYGVQRLIRVGSCGAVQAHLKLNDVLLAHNASTDSAFNRVQFGGLDFAACASPYLVTRFLNYCEQAQIELIAGQVFSTDSFYGGPPERLALLQEMGVLAVEMEAAALYGVAARYGVQALTLLTVSDHIIKGEHLSSDDRQTSFAKMIELTLAALSEEL